MRRTLLIGALLLATPAGRAAAQVTVQQPVVSNFNVTTTVSVPDRGTALLGGVSRSAAGRTRPGFWPRIGGGFGREVSHSNVTASVRIHDLRAMDEYLLSLDSGVAPPVAPAITARGLLSAGSNSRLASRDRRSTSHVSPSATDSGHAVAQRSFDLGLRAERDGKAGVARLHFQMAARHGSAEAERKLSARRP